LPRFSYHARVVKLSFYLLVQPWDGANPAFIPHYVTGDIIEIEKPGIPTEALEGLSSVVEVQWERICYVEPRAG
jgi:hypothetical protein